MDNKTFLREELIFLLDEAAELEHSLACSYLFAAFSLKTDPDEGLAANELAAVQGWQKSLINVAIEEMMHLAVVSDLLVALGSAPNLDRPNFPVDCSYYLPEYQIELRPFSESTLRQFIAIEQPEGMNLVPTIDPARLQRVVGDLDNEIGPDPVQFDSQRDVYGVIELGLRNLAERLGEENLFIGPSATPHLRTFFESNGWRPITGLEAALEALNLIVTQGEGAQVGNQDSHFERFNEIFREYEALKQVEPQFEPARPVLANPFTRTPSEASGPVNLITDEFAIQVSDLFNECYGGMLQLLGRFFIATEETEAEAATLCDASIEVMSSILGPLGRLLTRLPAGAEHDGSCAGPSFVLRNLHPLPQKEPARRRLHERFEELAAYTRSLEVPPSAETARTQQVELIISSVASSLTKVAQSLA